MKDSVAIKKGLLWCAIKGNRVSSVYINGRVCTLPLPIREQQKVRNLKENLLESYLQESSLFLYWASFV